MTRELISDTCEVQMAGRECGSPALVCYAAMGGGWMALCQGHGAKHVDICLPIAVVRARGRDHYDAVMRERHAAWLQQRRVSERTAVARVSGADLRARRKELGLSVEDVAREAHYAYSTIVVYESGHASQHGHSTIAAALERLAARREQRT